jgi:hypothetical protein
VIAYICYFTEQRYALGHVVVVGNGALLSGTVTNVSNGQATILLTEAYGPETVSVVTPVYNLRIQKLKQ